VQPSITVRERTFEEYGRLLYRSRWAIVLIFGAVVLSSIIFSLVVGPVYEAHSVLMIEPRTGKEGLSSVLDVSGYIQPGTFNVSVINNQVEILKSFSLAERTLERLKELYGTEKISLFHSDKGMPSQHVLVRRLQAMTTVVPLREADIIEIRVRTSDPWQANVIANAVADTYISENRSTAREDVREVKGFLQEQISMVRARLAEAEDKLKAYQEREKVASLPDEITVLVDKSAYFEGLYNEAAVDLQTARKKLNASNAQLADQQSSLVDRVAQVSSPVIAQLRGEIATLEAIRSKYIAQGYSENHEKMLEIERRIDETKRNLLKNAKDAANRELAAADPLAFSQGLVDKILTLQVDVETMGSRVTSLKNVADAYESQLEKLPEKSLQLARLQRAAKVDENVLTMLMEKYEESRIREAGEMGSVRMIDRANQPDAPIRPRKKINVLVGGVLGLLLSVGFMFARDRFDRTIVDIEEVETVSGVPVLGWIPAIRNSNSVGLVKRNLKKGSRAQESGSNVERRLLTHLDPHSPVSEAYRTLRTNVRFLGVDEPVKAVVVSSPGPSEGKSTTVANLAITMAQAGARTLLVDSDLRRPTLDGILDLKRGYGLTEVLTGACSVEECISRTEVDNLSIIGSGTLPPNPSEMLGSEKMRKVVSSLRESYDYVLFDSPPVLAVTDAAVLSAIADLTVLVVRSGSTRWTSLGRAISLLQNVHVKQLGTVLNAIEIEGIYGRYHDYYGYYKRGSSKT